MGERTATGPNGEKVVLRDGQWVPLDNGRVSFNKVNEGFSGLYAAQNPEAQPRINQGLRQGFGSFVSNLLSIPHASGKLLAAGAALPALVPGGKSFADAQAEQEKKLPASALLAIPDVSTEEVLAAPTALGRSFSGANANARRARAGAWDTPMAPTGIRENFRNAVAEEEKLAADNALSSSAGRTAGDVASMLTLRPGQRVAKGLDLQRFNPRASLDETKGALDSAARTLYRGMGRVAEAGFDGAVIGALGDGDPAKTAAWSAGIQAGGSMALAAKNAFFRNPLKSFAALYLGHEMWKSVAPGPQDLFDSKDTAVNEMVTAYGLGAAAALAGSTRGVGAGNIQRVSDALSSASRATVASVVTQLQEASASNQPQYARVLELMSQDQERFGTDARVRLERAARSDAPRALLNEIDSLMESARFRKALEESDAPEQPKQGFADWLMQR